VAAKQKLAKELASWSLGGHADCNTSKAAGESPAQVVRDVRDKEKSAWAA
jgi:hypothetical protein